MPAEALDTHRRLTTRRAQKHLNMNYSITHRLHSSSFLVIGFLRAPPKGTTMEPMGRLDAIADLA